MPYYYYGRRRFVRCRNTRRPTRTGVTKKYVRSAIKKASETKERRRLLPTDLVGANSISFGSGALIAGLYGDTAQGAGHTQRIGNRIRAVGLNMDFWLEGGDTTNLMRCIVVTPRKGGIRYQPTDKANFVQNLFSNTVSSSVQHLAPVDTSRWKVHYDKSIFLRYVPTFGSGLSTDVYAMKHHVKKFIKFNRPVQFDDQGQITDDIYLVMLSDSSAPPHPGVIVGFVNAYFKDI